MSSPNIALHKITVMKKNTEKEHIKRTQKDYSLSFKLHVVHEIEQGLLSLSAARVKYGIQGSYTIQSMFG